MGAEKSAGVSDVDKAIYLETSITETRVFHAAHALSANTSNADHPDGHPSHPLEQN